MQIFAIPAGTGRWAATYGKLPSHRVTEATAAATTKGLVLLNEDSVTHLAVAKA